MDATAVFVVLGVVGLLLLVLGLVVGDLLDGALDVLDLGGWLSGAAVGGFLAALGFGGLLAEGATGSVPAGAAVGVLAGVLVGAVAGWATRLLAGSSSDATRRGDDLVGVAGEVLTAVPSGGYGEVALRLHGHRLKLGARSSVPLARGARVWVAEVLSPTSVRVEPVDALEGGAPGGGPAPA